MVDPDNTLEVQVSVVRNWMDNKEGIFEETLISALDEAQGEVYQGNTKRYTLLIVVVADAA